MKGWVIIDSCLFRIFGMDIPDAAFSPLDIHQFTEYFLVPYIAHKFIMEDMQCNEAEAYTIMLDSGQLGEEVHPEDDDDLELQTILDGNTDAVRERFWATEVRVEYHPFILELRKKTRRARTLKTLGNPPNSQERFL